MNCTIRVPIRQHNASLRAWADDYIAQHPRPKAQTSGAPRKSTRGALPDGVLTVAQAKKIYMKAYKDEFTKYGSEKSAQMAGTFAVVGAGGIRNQLRSKYEIAIKEARNELKKALKAKKKAAPKKKK